MPTNNILGGLNIKNNLKTEKLFAEKLVECIENAVSDDIKYDISSNDFFTTNSKSFRIWDFINSNIKKEFDNSLIKVAKTNRGFWEFVIVYNNENKNLYTIMREKRFKELQNDRNKRNKPHYLDAFIKIFNKDLADYEQLSFGIPCTTLPTNDDLLEITNTITDSIQIDYDSIDNHVLILFDSFKYILTSVRAVMVDSNFSIACEESWNDYITYNESSIISPLTNSEVEIGNPINNLQLKEKAITKKKQPNIKFSNIKNQDTQNAN